ncbi:MAG: NAD(P)-dependent alcohol dehydrogenase [Xanthobacteraceae bacterium]|nr:NAD(P)-dependent alcohol dehydrogenase [Xanthobacteraceae bacterium]
MIVQAAIIHPGEKEFRLERARLDEPRADEILVRMLATGICHTDLKALEPTSIVPRPVVLGHEGAGIVERIGSGVTDFTIGDHVVMTVNSCGQCRSCREHEPAYCADLGPRNFGGRRTDGSSPLSRGDGGSAQLFGNFFGQSSFGTHAISNIRNTVKVPKRLPLKSLAPLGCGIQTGAGSVLNVFKPRIGQSLVVFGTGAVGLSAILAARLMPTRPIIAVDLLPERRKLALELGADHALDPQTEDVAQAIRDLTDGGADFTLDTTGNAQVIQQAFASLAPRGTCGVLATPIHQKEIAFAISHFVMGGRQLQGIIQGGSDPKNFIPQMIALHEQGRFPFDRLITYYSFAEINRACADAASGAAIKPVLLFD